MFTIEQERARLLNRILRIFSLVGVFAGIPSIWASLQFGLIALAVVDGTACLVAIAVAFLPGMSFRVKLLTMVAIVFAVGTAVLLATGPYGAGHIWIMCGVLLSALFGSRRAILAALVFATLFMIAYGILSAMGALPYDPSVLSVIVVGINMIAICAGLSYVLYSFMDGMMRGVNKQEILSQELHHRVKNNLQVTLSLISLEAYGAKPTPSIVALERRVRILTAVNELFLNRPDSLRMDVRALARALSGCAQQWTIVSDNGLGGTEAGSFEMDSADAAHFAIGAGELLHLLAPTTVIIQPLPRAASVPPRIRLRLAPGSPGEQIAEIEAAIPRDATIRSLLEPLHYRPLAEDSTGGPGFEIDAASISDI